MDISKLLDNPIAKTLLLKKLENAWNNNGLTLITITKKGEDFEFNTYTEEMKVISKTELNNIINPEE